MRCLNPTVLFWESSALSAFSPPTTTAFALPVCTNVCSLIYALKIKQQSEHKRSPPHLRHALQTSTHLLAGFLAHHVRAEWVSVIRRPCLTLHVPGDYKVSASVFPRQVTHPLSEQLLSLRLGFPQLLLDLHDIQQGRAVRGLKFIRNQNNRR